MPARLRPFSAIAIQTITACRNLSMLLVGCGPEMLTRTVMVCRARHSAQHLAFARGVNGFAKPPAVAPTSQGYFAWGCFSAVPGAITRMACDVDVIEPFRAMCVRAGPLL
jgi:hypothetical protein